MPTRKQRRRREKTFRHEYETVLLDVDGTERPLDEDELREEREARAEARAAAKPAQAKGGRTRPTRPVREVAPPTWERAFRRGGVMGGLMLIAFVFLFKNAPIGLRLAWGAFYAVAFIPLTYWVDRTTYRAYQRRTAKRDAKK